MLVGYAGVVYELVYLWGVLMDAWIVYFSDRFIYIHSSSRARAVMYLYKCPSFSTQIGSKTVMPKCFRRSSLVSTMT